MRLYKLILVDDEAEVRESIIRKIDWEAAGFQLVGDAENGVDALEKVDILEPDIVLTDIRMPYMDGLELAERIHQAYPLIKLVFFSGFDEFEYAKQAIKLNVIEYILKPVNVDELTQVLGKIKQTLDAEVRRRRNIEELRERFMKSLPILRELFLEDLTHGRVEAHRISQLAQEYGIPLDVTGRHIVAQIAIDRFAGDETNSGFSLEGELELVPISVQRTLEDLLGRYTRFASFRSSMGIGVIAALEPPATLDGLIYVLNDVCRECRLTLGLTVTIGLGHPARELFLISESYREALEAVGFKAMAGAGRVIFIGDMERGRNPVSVLQKDTESKLIAAIKFDGPAEVKAAVERVSGDIVSTRAHLGNLQFYAISVMNSLLRLAAVYELDLSGFLGAQTDFWSCLSQGVGLDALEKQILKLCLYINEKIYSIRGNNAQSIIAEAKRYISDNYRDPELSLEAVCAGLHISSAYFSTLFKRETGVSYTNYLTQLRLEAAMELLKSTDDKTYQIAEQVGYADPNYFGYVFKKRFGVSPAKYRAQLN